MTASGEGERTLRSAKAGWLLTYLALQPDGIATRNELVSVLWGRVDEASGRTSLRQALARLRAVFAPNDPAVFSREADKLRLDFDQLEVDAVELLRCDSLAIDDAPQETFRRWSQELLRGVLPAEDDFNHWLRNRRSHLRSHVEALAIDEINRRCRAGLDALPLARALLEYDPSQEFASRVIMQGEAANGNVTAALRCFDTLCEHLRTELDTLPSQATRDLAGALRRGDLPSAVGYQPAPDDEAAAAVSSYTHDPRQPILIAVLPPDLIAEARDNGIRGLDYLWEGCAEELRSRLAGFRTFSILSSSVTARYSHRPDRVAALRRELGVRYVFEGSVSRWAGGYKMHVGVVKSADETYVWRQPFPFITSELLSVNDTIFSRMTVSIDQAVTRAEIQASLQRGTEVLSAFDWWARANSLFHHWNSSSDERAVEYLSKSIECDADYASPYTIWAGVCNSRRFLRPGNADEMHGYLREATSLASSAVSLDPHYARSRVALGWAFLHQRRFEDAREQFSLAAELNPYDTDTLIACAVASAYLDRPLTTENLDGRTLADRVSAICRLNEPDYYHVYRAIVYHLDGEHERCVEALLEARNPMAIGYSWLCASLLRLGRNAEAHEAAGAMLDEVRDPWRERLGETPTEQQVMQWLREVTPLQSAPALQELAAGYTSIGLPDMLATGVSH